MVSWVSCTAFSFDDSSLSAGNSLHLLDRGSNYIIANRFDTGGPFAVNKAA